MWISHVISLLRRERRTEWAAWMHHVTVAFSVAQISCIIEALITRRIGHRRPNNAATAPSHKSVDRQNRQMWRAIHLWPCRDSLLLLTYFGVFVIALLYVKPSFSVHCNRTLWTELSLLLLELRIGIGNFLFQLLTFSAKNAGCSIKLRSRIQRHKECAVVDTV